MCRIGLLERCTMSRDEGQAVSGPCKRVSLPMNNSPPAPDMAHGTKRSPMDILSPALHRPPDYYNIWSDAEICDESVDISVDADTTLYFMNV